MVTKMNNLFDEIEKEKKSLPGIDSVAKKFVGKKKLNVYQVVSIIAFIVGLIGGIFLGNMIPACNDSFSIITGACSQTQFNVGITLMVWAGTFLFSLLFYGFGTMIATLESIDKKLK